MTRKANEDMDAIFGKALTYLAASETELTKVSLPHDDTFDKRPAKPETVLTST